MGKELINKVSDIAADLPAVRVTREDIRKHFCPLATDQEVALGLAIVKSLNLNPFLREVHFIKYDAKSKMAIVVGYEVYLKRAERTGKLDGWTAGINTAENFAWVKIHRKDWKEPFEWTVNLAEFNKKQSTWNQIPSFMGRKVAIAQGFRLCFPDELGGMPYTQEEHEVYDIEAKEVIAKPQVRVPQAISASKTTEDAPEVVEADKTQPAQNSVEEPAIVETPAKFQVLESLAKVAFKKNKEDWINFLGSEYGVERITELKEDQIKDCLQQLQQKIKDDKK